jgi:hypothetical protein
MSEPKTLESLHKEYSSLCAKAGHLQYQIVTLTAELVILNETLKVLNLDASAISVKAKVEAEAPRE